MSTHRINITISSSELEAIDKFCEAERYTRSRLLITSALDFINTHQYTPEVKKEISKDIHEHNWVKHDYCEMHHSKPTASSGRYKVEYNDWELGETSKEASLCDIHVKQLNDDPKVISVTRL